MTTNETTVSRPATIDAGEHEITINKNGTDSITAFVDGRSYAEARHDGVRGYYGAWYVYIDGQVVARYKNYGWGKAHQTKQLLAAFKLGCFGPVTDHPAARAAQDALLEEAIAKKEAKARRRYGV